MNLFDDTYKTISMPSEGIFRDKGSKFIAYARPVQQEDEARVAVTEIKAAHPKARHHCWALRLTTDRSVFRLNDDGEPSGTAGRPILNTLLSFDVTNIIVVVVRYFGGTLLGIPGLINAYKSATQDALSRAPIIEKHLEDIYCIHFSYVQMNEVMRIIKEHELTIKAQQFDNSCTMNVAVRQSDNNKVTSKLSTIDNLKINYLYSI